MTKLTGSRTRLPTVVHKSAARPFRIESQTRSKSCKLTQEAKNRRSNIQAEGTEFRRRVSVTPKSIWGEMVNARPLQGKMQGLLRKSWSEFGYAQSRAPGVATSTLSVQRTVGLVWHTAGGCRTKPTLESAQRAFERCINRL